MPRLAAAACASLVGCWFSPSLLVSLGLWFLCGLCTAYQIPVMTRFVRQVPAHQRGLAVGLGATGLTAIQGIGALAAGALASLWSPAVAVGMAGSAGVLVVGALARPLRRAERSDAAEPHRVCPALPGNEPS